MSHYLDPNQRKKIYFITKIKFVHISEFKIDIEEQLPLGCINLTTEDFNERLKVIIDQHDP